ncbi:hypothetical protein BaRGS_00004698 [Batillaria attramentaria]|uniref:Ribonuclease H1 n=1 Tax=Batillaria attramentaria TaxID=370345 RepID=A0ABD0LWQ9_9CAEN
MSFYAVKRGRNPGVYHTWPECQAQVKGFCKPVFKKFPTSEEAWAFVGTENMSGCDDASEQSSQRGSSYSTYSSTPSKPESSQNRSKFSSNRTNSNTTSPSSYSADTPTSPTAAFEAIGMLRATARALRSTAEQLLSSIDGLSSQIEQVASALHSSANGSASFAGSRRAEGVRDNLKRSFSDFTPLGGADAQPKKPKYMKKDPSGTTDSGFTGTPFPDDEGTPVYTDGASIDNGRATARAGIGVFWGHNSPHNVAERLAGKQTNNRAEIHAAKVAIQQAKRKGIKNLVLHTDSEFLINGITKWIRNWKRNGWKLSTGGPVVNREDFEELDAASQDMNVKWVHVRGHCGIEGNEAADRLANEGAQKSLPS